MENLEISARTVEEATKKALTRLNVGLDKVEITVLNEGRGGILGLGAEDARISVRLMEPEKDEESVKAARDILENLLSLLNIKARVEVKPPSITDDGEESNSEILNIVTQDSIDLIGRRGQILDAIQYLVRLMASKLTRSKIPIIIDVQGYKQRRYDDLRTLALNVASQVKTRNTSIRLEPMSAFERRIVHMALAGDPEIATESVGEGESRKVVVFPKSRK